MGNPPNDPDVADTAPTDPTLTDYDRQHFVTYLRLLDADDELVHRFLEIRAQRGAGF